MGEKLKFFWSVKFVLIDNLSRHPSQLYEAVFEGLILFIILNYLIKRDAKKEGYVFIIIFNLLLNF